MSPHITADMEIPLRHRWPRRLAAGLWGLSALAAGAMVVGAILFTAGSDDAGGLHALMILVALALCPLWLAVAAWDLWSRVTMGPTGIESRLGPFSRQRRWEDIRLLEIWPDRGWLDVITDRQATRLNVDAEFLREQRERMMEHWQYRRSIMAPHRKPSGRSRPAMTDWPGLQRLLQALYFLALMIGLVLLPTLLGGDTRVYAAGLFPAIGLYLLYLLARLSVSTMGAGVDSQGELQLGFRPRRRIDWANLRAIYVWSYGHPMARAVRLVSLCGDGRTRYALISDGQLTRLRQRLERDRPDLLWVEEDEQYGRTVFAFQSLAGGEVSKQQAAMAGRLFERARVIRWRLVAVHILLTLVALGVLLAAAWWQVRLGRATGISLAAMGVGSVLLPAMAHLAWQSRRSYRYSDQLAPTAQ